MQTDLAPKDEPIIPADDWVRAGQALNEHATWKGRMTQAELERLEAEYLANGGEIRQIPMGVSAEIVMFNNCPVVASQNSPFSHEERCAHQATKAHRRFRGDGEMVAKIKTAIPTVSTARELYEACGISADKLERLLRDYLADDESAKPFRKMSRDEREAMVKAQYPGIAAENADHICAKILHITYPELKRIIALYGLKPVRIVNEWNAA